jgi:ribonucleoside-diphosphate reductase alpha chain
MWNENWKKGEDYPAWGNNDVYKKTISGGYLFDGETPREAYMRVAKTVARRLYKPEMAETFFEYIWNGWLCLASPVLSNTGTDRGLPISCFGIDVADSIQDIGQKNLEMMLLAKHGGGVGIGVNMIRPAGAKITGNGTSDGVVPFCKIYDSTILATNQGSVRRGAASVNINIEHDDFEEWLEIREPKGDVNRQSLNLHQCAIVGDKFMRRLEQGDADARNRWSKLLRKRKATGEPYIMFKGNVNKANPPAYKENGLKVHMTNICSEITLHTDESHSFVCCLSSLNLAKYEEWKDTNLIYDATFFLDGVMEEFIQRAKGLRGFENAVRSAQKGEHWAWESLDGIHISRRKVFLLKVYSLSLKLGKYFRRLKSKVKELPGILLRFTASLCGVLVLVIVILICVLLLPLLVIQSLAGMFRQE